ncbi:MAG: hypothetical protein MI863_03155 [Desulfobacterales bacterium]|nr:hypothetical protein [Desulfobacterales bacterium]
MSDTIEYERLTEALIEIWTIYQGAITRHGVKDIAHELKKSDKTIYAEVSLSNLHTYIESIRNYSEHIGKPGYNPKLGLVDFIIGMIKSKDVAPLVAVASFFKMACFKVPEKGLDKEDVLQLLQNMNKEYTEGVNATLEAVKDNTVSRDEARDNRKECMDIVNAASRLMAFYDAVLDDNQ